MTAAEHSARSPWRAPILVLVVVVLVAGVAAGRARTAKAPKPVAAIDAAQRSTPGALSTAWYCPGLPKSFPTGAQTFTLSNLGSSDADVVVTVQPDSGANPIVRTLTVPPDTVQTFSRGSLALVSVMSTSSAHGHSGRVAAPPNNAASTLPPGPMVVEPFSSDVVVSAGIETATSLAVVPCADTASADWYFAAGTTVRGVSEYLVIDDPFSGDARVDVTLRTGGGMQQLPSLQGIDVPGRSRVVIPIQQSAVLQTAVAVQVHADVGRVVATQTLDYVHASGPPGVATALGALAPSSQWWFTDGQAFAGASQVVAVTDVSQLDAQVVVQALLASKGIVQPVVLKVPSGSVAWVQIGGCGQTQADCLQVPAKRGYEIEVQSDGGLPIVAETLSRFTNANTALGATTSMGSTVPALEWVIARTRVIAERSTSISVMNSGVAAARISVEVVHNGAVDRPADVQNVTVASNSRYVLPADTAGASHLDDAAVVITSDAPVFAESTIYADQDATRVPGIPTR